MLGVQSVRAVANRGLVGDRYYLGTGFYSNIPGWGANVTLIQSEALAAINVGYEASFTGAMLRRNIITANLDLETLIGREFRCGDALLRGLRRFPPCTHLAHLLGRPEVLKYFAHCGGIGAAIVSDGEIEVTDRIELLDSPAH
ncbi:MAG TPA: MOSC domain-containing protein [Pirellulales bacterium]